MSLVRVIGLLSARKIVTIDSTSYALIEGRIRWVKMVEGEMHVFSQEPQMSINEFAVICETFRHHDEDHFEEMPEEAELLSPCGEYDFTKMPKKHECLHCFFIVTHENAVLEQKYAHCPKCGNQFYRATRLDGVREDGLIYRERRTESTPKKVVEKPKVKERSVEEIIDSGSLQKCKRNVRLRLVIV